MDALSLLHLNDVYNAEKSPRFVYQWKEAKLTEEKNGRVCLSFFSGDAWSPSIMSAIVRGKQMVPVLNALGLDAACLGNHDLDLGLHQFEALRDQCNFPWICSNVTECQTKQQLGGCHEYVVVEAVNMRFLVIGLVEEEWIDTLATVEPDDILYEDFCSYVHRRVPALVKENRVDGVIALSHMRMPNDYKVAKECGGYIDILLGGHDHHYEDTTINNIRILNSGTDFSDFSIVQIHGRENQPREIDCDTVLVITHPLKTTCQRIQVDLTSQNEDPGMVDALKDMKELLTASMETVVGHTKVPLDARFSEVRTKETNVSNFIAGLMTMSTGADIAILNSGSLRIDRIIPTGPITTRVLHDILPMEDPLAVVELDASSLLQALENGVSKFPAMEGRFPAVDGVRFDFDPEQPPTHRIIESSVLVFDKESGEFQPINMSKKYTVVSKAYLLKGKDGYDSFAGAKKIRDEEDCASLNVTLRNVFSELSVLKHWQRFTVKGSVIDAASKFKRLIRRSVADPYAICPVIDGRINNIRDVSNK